MSETKWVEVTDESQLREGVKFKCKCYGARECGTAERSVCGGWWIRGSESLYIIGASGYGCGITELYIEAEATPKREQPERHVVVTIGSNSYHSDGIIMIGDSFHTDETITEEINTLQRARSQYRAEKKRGQW